MIYRPAIDRNCSYLNSVKNCRSITPPIVQQYVFSTEYTICNATYYGLTQKNRRLLYANPVRIKAETITTHPAPQTPPAQASPAPIRPSSGANRAAWSTTKARSGTETPSRRPAYRPAIPKRFPCRHLYAIG